MPSPAGTTTAKHDHLNSGQCWSAYLVIEDVTRIWNGALGEDDLVVRRVDLHAHFAIGMLLGGALLQAEV